MSKVVFTNTRYVTMENKYWRQNVLCKYVLVFFRIPNAINNMELIHTGPKPLPKTRTSLRVKQLAAIAPFFIRINLELVSPNKTSDLDSSLQKLFGLLHITLYSNTSSDKSYFCDVISPTISYSFWWFFEEFVDLVNFTSTDFLYVVQQYIYSIYKHYISL